jgi:hypothetical protein
MSLRSRARRSLPVATAIAVMIGLAGCRGGANPTAGGQAPAVELPGGISERIRAALDSAAVALEAGDAVRARDLFASVLSEDTTLAAAWIGLHLAERAAAGDGADSALHRARSLIEPPPRLPRRAPPRPAT